MKRVISTLLLLLVLVHLVGVYLFVGVRLYEFHRDARKAKMWQSPDLVTLQFTAQQVRVILNGEDEIRWLGQMYDVLKVTKSGDKYLLLAYPDKEEGELFAFIDTLSTQDSPTPKVPPNWTQFLTLTFIAETALDFDTNVSFKEAVYTLYSKHSKSIQQQVLVPPPRV